MSPENLIPTHLIPDPGDYDFDLAAALTAVVTVRTTIPADAFTAGPLGTERGGYGVLIRGDGLVLTIGYLVTEAETVWLTLADGRAVSGHVLGYDQETGFGLIQALARIDLPALPFGNSAAARVGHPVVVGGAGGREQSVAARIVAKQEFAGYWEYLLDEAIITAPAHPRWGGAALIGGDGALLGIGSLLVQSSSGGGETEDHNMMVPIDLLPPILDDMLTLGKPRRPARPWLGVYVTEIEGRVVVANLAEAGPAAGAGLRAGDLILATGGAEVDCLATFYRHVWAQGPAGVAVPLRIYRDGRARDLTVSSADRNDFLKAPVAH